MDEQETEDWIKKKLNAIDQTHAVGSVAGAGYLFPEYRDDQLGFMSNVLGSKTGDSKFDHKAGMWAGQRAVIKSVEANKYTAVYSARGEGKDFLAGRLALSFFYTRPCRILCLAPSMRQLQHILFGEISKAFYSAKVRLRGELQTMRLKMPGDTRHYILGVPAADPDRVRGFHAGVSSPGDPDADDFTQEELLDIARDFAAATREEDDMVLIIVDEPEGIPNEVFRVLEGTMSKSNTKMLLIGNPAQSITDEHLYPRALRGDSVGWHTINLSAIGHDEFPGENLTQLAMFDEIYDDTPRWLIPQAARDKAVKEYDSQDPIFLSDMRGLFSEDAIAAQVIPSSALHLSMERYDDNHRRRAIGPRIGLDLGFGGDPSVATLMVDGVVRDVVSWRDSRDDHTMQVTMADRIIDLTSDWGHAVYENFPESWDGGAIVGERLSIDQTGLPGVADILAAKGVECDRVNFSAAFRGDGFGLVDTSYKMQNERAGMYWAARMGLQDGLFHIPFSDKYRSLREELPWTLYEREFETIKLERKVETIKRHGHSPDFADSFVLACRANSGGPVMWSTGGPLLTRTENLTSVDTLRDASHKKRIKSQWTRLN